MSDQGPIARELRGIRLLLEALICDRLRSTAPVWPVSEEWRKQGDALWARYRQEYHEEEEPTGG